MDSPVKQSAAEDFIGRRLSLAAQRCREWMDREMAGLGGGIVGWLVLKHAGHVEHATLGGRAGLGGPILAGPGDRAALSQKELAGRLSIGGPAMVRHIDRLAREGLIERRPDPSDRRVTRLFVTPAGEQRRNELDKLAAGFDAELRSLLTEREAATLLRALAKIERHITTQHPQRWNGNS